MDNQPNPNTLVADIPVPSQLQHADTVLLGQVPGEARQVLVLGNEAEPLALALLARQTCEVKSDSGRAALPFAAGYFDCLVLAGALECSRDPWGMFQQCAPLLCAGGALACKVPNIRHIDIIDNLSQGKWRYSEQGVLNRSHLHFFTRSSFTDLLKKYGFAVEEVVLVKDPQYAENIFPAETEKIAMGLARIELRDVTAVEFAEFTASHLIFRARAQAVQA